MTIISTYTREEAISDGILLRLEDYLRNEVTKEEYVHDNLEMVQGGEGKFPMGDLLITAAAAEALHPVDVLHCLLCHKYGDWGELGAEDTESNENAVHQGDRLFSAYNVEHKSNNNVPVRIYVITEWNREATTIMLPGDY